MNINIKRGMKYLKNVKVVNIFGINFKMESVLIDVLIINLLTDILINALISMIFLMKMVNI